MLSYFQSIVAFTAAIALIPAVWVPLYIFRVRRFNAAASKFKKAFFPMIQILINTPSSYPETIAAEFSKQEAATLVFADFLKTIDRKRHSRLNNKWTEYKKAYEQQLQSNDNIYLENMHYLVEQFKKPEFKIQLPLIQIEKLEQLDKILNTTNRIKKENIGLHIDNLFEIATKYE